MKKLMIAAAIVCAAAMVQAAGFSWKSAAMGTGGVLYDGSADSTWYAANPDKTDPAAAGTTLYLFAVVNNGGAESTAGALAAKALFSAMTADTWSGLANYSGSEAWQVTAALGTDSKITTTPISGGAYTGTFDFFFAAEGKNADGEDVFYISNVLVDKAYKTSGSTSIQYGDLDATSKTTLKTADGWQGAGVYAVPEPTSGLLLLLGVAGLALRRRRA